MTVTITKEMPAKIEAERKERGDGWHCVTCHAEPPRDWFA